MNKDIIILVAGIIARHLVAALGGHLSSSPELVNELTGALVVLLSIAASVYFKVKSK